MLIHNYALEVLSHCIPIDEEKSIHSEMIIHFQTLHFDIMIFEWLEKHSLHPSWASIYLRYEKLTGSKWTVLHTVQKQNAYHQNPLFKQHVLGLWKQHGLSDEQPLMWDISSYVHCRVFISQMTIEVVFFFLKQENQLLCGSTSIIRKSSEKCIHKIIQNIRRDSRRDSFYAKKLILFIDHRSRMHHHQG